MPMMSLDGEWLIATDPNNIGCAERWYVTSGVADAQKTQVPSVIQQTFPGYAGLAWYWRRFDMDRASPNGARILLRLSAVDYLANVWLNGVHIGQHEGGEVPFTFDVTDAVRLGEPNNLVVRVLNPGNERIDGIVIAEIPHRTKSVPYMSGRGFNWGGIWQPVDLLTVPEQWLADVHVKTDTATGDVTVQSLMTNATGTQATRRLLVSIAPAAGGSTLSMHEQEVLLPAGETTAVSTLGIGTPRLWSLDDPYLYRVTVRLAGDDGVAHETSTRCGFREFCFSDGAFRLNGKRLFLRSAHCGNHYPVGYIRPPDAELMRRDLYFAKTMGFNMIRYLGLMPYPAQLDMCDELGLLIYEENLASWRMQDSPHMRERFDHSMAGMVRRDRNHPSVVAWGVLNEETEGPVFRHAVNTLPLIRSLDDSRMVLLSSGRFDGDLSIGSLANPGSQEWQPLLGHEGETQDKIPLRDPRYVETAGDLHYYPGHPLKPNVIERLRKLGHGSKPVFLTELGNGSQIDAPRLVRLYEQSGARQDLTDYAEIRGLEEKYLADWQRMGLDNLYADPSQPLVESQRIQAEQRLTTLNILRSNPSLCGYSMTSLYDPIAFAEGNWTSFRELKPGMVDAIRDGLAPLRWCLFAEPVHAYCGDEVRLEAVLANEDVLRAGEYPVALKVFGPGGEQWDARTTLHIAPSRPGAEAPLALPVYAGAVRLDGPPGEYTFVAMFERGAAPVGGRIGFRLSDRGSLPKVTTGVTLWSDDSQLAPWLDAHNVPWQPLAAAGSVNRSVILVGGAGGAPTDREGWTRLATNIMQGSVVIFLSPQALDRDGDATGWMPLKTKGQLSQARTWAAARNDFAQDHPIFDGLPGRGYLDLTFYRDLIPEYAYDGQEGPEELVAGALGVGYYGAGLRSGYYSGVHVGVYRLGAGWFVLNTFLLLENLGKHPAADHLLLNMIRYAAAHAAGPLAKADPHVIADLYP